MSTKWSPTRIVQTTTRDGRIYQLFHFQYVSFASSIANSTGMEKSYLKLSNHRLHGHIIALQTGHCDLMLIEFRQ